MGMDPSHCIFFFFCVCDVCYLLLTPALVTILYWCSYTIQRRKKETSSLELVFEFYFEIFFVKIVLALFSFCWSHDDLFKYLLQNTHKKKGKKERNWNIPWLWGIPLFFPMIDSTDFLHVIFYRPAMFLIRTIFLFPNNCIVFPIFFLLELMGDGIQFENDKKVTWRSRCLVASFTHTRNLSFDSQCLAVSLLFLSPARLILNSTQSTKNLFG